MPSEEKEDNSVNGEYVNNNLWQIRPCHLYKEEYKDCTSFKARFHQYFIFGESSDCSQWEKDFQNCSRFENNKDIKSGLEIIESETARRKLRLQAHYLNNVWEKRVIKPPESWNQDLPEWMKKEFENTYLNIKSKELKNSQEKFDMKKYETGMCVIC